MDSLIENLLTAIQDLIDYPAPWKEKALRISKAREREEVDVLGELLAWFDEEEKNNHKV